jgi:hypothetical protein
MDIGVLHLTRDHLAVAAEQGVDCGIHPGANLIHGVLPEVQGVSGR